MRPLSTFRGTCGEVVTDYISPLTFVPALPIVLGICALGWLCKIVGDYGASLYPFLVAIFVTLATMRFALPASRGTYEPSNNGNEVMIYSCRFLLVNAVWLVPWLVVCRTWSKSPANLTMQDLLNVTGLIQAPFLLIAQSLLLLMALVLPVSCLLIVLFSSSLKGIFSRQYLDWLLTYRRADLSPFWSALIGGCLVMLLLAILPVSLLVAISTKIFGLSALYTATFFLLWVVATIPVLIGRLTGAFVAHDHLTLDFIPPEQVHLSDETVNSVPPPVAKPMAVRPDIAGIERRIAMLDESAVHAVLKSMQERGEASPAQPLADQIERLLLLLRTGQRDEARICAAAAIEAACQGGFNDICFMLFERLGTERRKVKLSAPALEIIGSINTKRNQLLDAAWCLHAAAVTTGDEIKAQKRLFQLAETAERAGNLKDAATLYDIFIKQYPHSTFLEYAQQGADRIKGRPV